jgi:hypothetical protein
MVPQAVAIETGWVLPGLKPVQFRPVNYGSTYVFAFAALERAHHARRSSRSELYADRGDAS